MGSTTTWVLGVEDLQGMHHGTGKYVCVFLAAKVEAVDLSGITPLVEGLRGLIVLKPFGNGTVYHHLDETKKEETSCRLVMNNEVLRYLIK